MRALGCLAAAWAGLTLPALGVAIIALGLLASLCVSIARDLAKRA